ncbi:unnamed protein product [Diplocarpon coronariae]
MVASSTEPWPLYIEVYTHESSPKDWDGVENNIEQHRSHRIVDTVPQMQFKLRNPIGKFAHRIGSSKAAELEICFKGCRDILEIQARCSRISTPPRRLGAPSLFTSAVSSCLRRVSRQTCKYLGWNLRIFSSSDARRDRGPRMPKAECYGSPLQYERIEGPRT